MHMFQCISVLKLYQHYFSLSIQFLNWKLLKDCRFRMFISSAFSFAFQCNSITWESVRLSVETLWRHWFKGSDNIYLCTDSSCFPLWELISKAQIKLRPWRTRVLKILLEQWGYIIHVYITPTVHHVDHVPKCMSMNYYKDLTTVSYFWDLRTLYSVDHQWSLTLRSFLSLLITLCFIGTSNV